jgi:hypothetical protein
MVGLILMAYGEARMRGGEDARMRGGEDARMRVIPIGGFSGF